MPQVSFSGSNEIDFRGIAISVIQPSLSVDDATSQIVFQTDRFWLTFW